MQTALLHFSRHSRQICNPPPSVALPEAQTGLFRECPCFLSSPLAQGASYSPHHHVPHAGTLPESTFKNPFFKSPACRIACGTEGRPKPHAWHMLPSRAGRHMFRTRRIVEAPKPREQHQLQSPHRFPCLRGRAGTCSRQNPSSTHFPVFQPSSNFPTA